MGTKRGSGQLIPTLAGSTMIKSKVQPRRPQSAKPRFRTSDYGALFYDGVNRHPYRRKFNHAEREVVKRPTAAWKYAFTAREEDEMVEAQKGEEKHNESADGEEQAQQEQGEQRSGKGRAPILKRPTERIASHYTRDAEWLGSPRRVYSSVLSTSKRPLTLRLASSRPSRTPIEFGATIRATGRVMATESVADVGAAGKDTQKETAAQRDLMKLGINEHRLPGSTWSQIELFDDCAFAFPRPSLSAKVGTASCVVHVSKPKNAAATGGHWVQATVAPPSASQSISEGITVRIPNKERDEREQVRTVGRLHVLGMRENSLHFFARLRAAEDLRWELKLASIEMGDILRVEVCLI